MSFTAKPNADGSVQLQANGVDRIVLNADGGVNTGWPVLRAYNTSAQSLSAAVYTKMVMPTVEFDSHNCFNNTASAKTMNGVTVPAYAFFPKIAGYYEAKIQLLFNANAGSYEMIAAIYKSTIEQGWSIKTTVAGARSSVEVSTTVYLNGTTDYLEPYGYVSVAMSTAVLGTSPARNFFSVSMVRAA